MFFTKAILHKDRPLFFVQFFRSTNSIYAIGGDSVGASTVLADNAEVGKAVENRRLTEMGRAYEHLEGAGGEKYFE